VNVAPWHPSGAVAAIVTTLLIDWIPDVELAAAAKARPVALATVTFDDGHAAGLLDVIVPAVIDVNVTGYGLGLVIVKNASLRN
jgi:hypothetical protein